MTTSTRTGRSASGAKLPRLSRPVGDTDVSRGIEASGIRVVFGSLVALDEVDLVVPPGSIVGLVGPNGAGKTTLLAVLSGILRPQRGRVTFAGQEITGLSPQVRAAMGITRTFQQPALFAGMTVREHLLLAHRMRHAPRRIWGDFATFRALRSSTVDGAEAARVDGLLDRLGLANVAEQIVDRLPLGHARLVEVGRALASEPHTVLLDEPASGLDGTETAQLRSVLEGFSSEQGVAFLLIDHDVETVLGVSSAVTVLDFGRVLAHGRPQDVAADPIVREAYLGSVAFGGSA